MGTWGVNTFENDDAQDWIVELQEDGSVDFLVSSFAADEADGGYLEAPDGARILCAAEVVAAVVSGDRDALPEEAASWLKAQRDLDFARLAPLTKAGVDRVLAEHSELRELWQENADDFPEWLSSVARLRSRLDTSMTVPGPSDTA